MLPEIDASGLSVTGLVREDNQDAILYPNGSAPVLAGSLHAVADGMGGYSHGGLASSTALKTLLSHLQRAHSVPPQKALRKGVESDSRAYLIRDGGVRCLTSDHTVVADMVRSKLIGPEKLRTHAQRSVLTRAVGLGPFIQPELVRLRLQADDRLILCSDGLWSVVQDDEFGFYTGQVPNVRALSQALVDLALERGTDDNCSVVTIHIPGFQSATAADEPSHERGWLNWARR